MFQNLNQALNNPVEYRPFNVQLRAYSPPFFQGADSRKIDELNYGGKILLPPSALDHLVRLNIQYPMMFKLSNVDRRQRAHCGVLEFIAEEGRCYLPGWMMRKLLLEEGGVVQAEYVNLPVATYAKFQPQHQEFLDITNPHAVLAAELRKFSCLTVEDCFAVHFNDKLIEFIVKEVKPGIAVAITDCDIIVEFDAPEGYVEPNYQQSQQHQDKESQTDVLLECRFFRLIKENKPLLNVVKTKYRHLILPITQLMSSKFQLDLTQATTDTVTILDNILRTVSTQTASTPENEIATELIADMEIFDLMVDIDSDLLFQLA